jgi:hypothetical protein
MAELEKGKSVSLEELMVSTLAMTDALTKATHRERRYHLRGVQAEAAGGACGLPAHSEPNDTVA